MQRKGRRSWNEPDSAKENLHVGDKKITINLERK